MLSIFSTIIDNQKLFILNKLSTIIMLSLLSLLITISIYDTRLSPECATIYKKHFTDAFLFKLTSKKYLENVVGLATNFLINVLLSSLSILYNGELQWVKVVLDTIAAIIQHQHLDTLAPSPFEREKFESVNLVGASFKGENTTILCIYPLSSILNQAKVKKDGSLEDEESFSRRIESLLNLYQEIIQASKPNDPLNSK